MWWGAEVALILLFFAVHDGRDGFSGDRAWFWLVCVESYEGMGYRSADIEGKRTVRSPTAGNEKYILHLSYRLRINTSELSLGPSCASSYDENP